MVYEKGISVIICCFNSDLRLPNTLKNIANQKFNVNIKWEVVVIDNNSNDGTTTTAINEWNKYTCNAIFNVVFEPRPGLIYARKTGILNARYEYIVFCDDDNWLFENYLQKAFEILERHPDIGAVGGMGIGVSDVEFPKWFKDVEGPYAIGRQQEFNGYLKNRLHLWGAGLASKKEILDKVFDDRYPLLLSGRKGSILLGGDDSEICARIQLLGYRLFYTDELKYKHYITQNRLTLEYKLKMFKGFELSGDILSKYFEFVNFSRKSFFIRILLSLRSLFVSSIKVFVKKDKKKYIERNYEQISVMLRISHFTKSEITKSIIKFIYQN